MTSESLSEPSIERIALVGAGAVGAALAHRLTAGGVAVEAVVSRTVARAREVADAVGAPIASDALEDLPRAIRTVILCVPDAAIAPVADHLSRLPRDWSGCLAVHTAGALSSAVLAPLAGRGARTLSFHPLQAFTRASGPEAFDGIYAGIEGDEAALRAGKMLAAVLGVTPVVFTPDEKLRCHLAASIASNFLVTLMAMAGQVLETTGLDAPTGAALLRPLVEGTWRNLEGRLPGEALTGPVVRGDAGTVRNHLQALDRHAPELLEAYRTLARETVRVAVRSGRLAQESAELLRERLEAPEVQKADFPAQASIIQRLR